MNNKNKFFFQQKSKKNDDCEDLGCDDHYRRMNDSAKKVVRETREYNKGWVCHRKYSLAPLKKGEIKHSVNQN